MLLSRDGLRAAIVPRHEPFMGKAGEALETRMLMKDSNSIMLHRAGTRNKEVKCKMESDFDFLFLLVKD